MTITVAKDFLQSIVVDAFASSLMNHAKKILNHRNNHMTSRGFQQKRSKRLVFTMNTEGIKRNC